MSALVTILQCPGCSSIARFASDKTNLAVCPVCSTVYLREGNTLTSKAIEIIPAPSSVIQPGTTGVWDYKPFTVLGRFTARFEESVFHYWTVEMADKSIAWIGEGYGLYYFMKPILNTNITVDIKTLRPTFGITVLRERYTVEKKQTVIGWGIEGEVWMPGTTPSFTVADLATAGANRVSLFQFQKGKPEPFEVFPANAGALQLKNTETDPHTPSGFSCLYCHTHVDLIAFPYSQSWGCPKCGAYHYLGENETMRGKGKARTDEAPAIPLGSKGTIDGVAYNVIGYALKEEDDQYHARWREYTLYNAREGFAFLSEFDGHWIFLKELADAPVLTETGQRQVYFDHRNFRLYNAYWHNVLNARGEFPYNIFNNQHIEAREFIAPPNILIREGDDKEGLKWFYGRHINPGEVEKNFTIDILPWRSGVGAVQPIGGLTQPQLIKASILGLLAIVIAFLLSSLTNSEKVVLDRSYFFPGGDTVNTVSAVTDRFVLDRRRANLELRIAAEVSNSWFELGATLVNANTGKEYSLEQGVEYYYGIEGGESWSEGKRVKHAYFTRIPAGTYFLQLQGTRDPYGYKLGSFSVTATYNVTTMGNLWCSLIIFILLPGGMLINMYLRESQRWANSPFAPVNQNDED